jgi:hypothetical protein
MPLISPFNKTKEGEKERTGKDEGTTKTKQR